VKLNSDSINLKEKGAVQQKLGKRLAELRNKKGISQEKFSFERGKRNPSLYMLWKFSKALHIKLSELTNTI